MIYFKIILCSIYGVESLGQIYTVITSFDPKLLMQVSS